MPRYGSASAHRPVSSFRVCHLSSGRTLGLCHLSILPCDPSRMQDHGLTVDQIIDTGTLALCTISLSRYKSNRMTISKCYAPLPKEIRRVETVRYRTAIIDDNAFSLIRTKCNVIGRLHGLDQFCFSGMLLLQSAYRHRSTAPSHHLTSVPHQ